MDYNVIWYVMIMFLLMGYAVLDGFDLGAGILHLFAKTDHERRVVLNSIGPVWDGNEVWLITAGGALFAAFPEVYATAFSGFYLAFMVLLFALIFRAVSIEFRSKEENKKWRQAWDMAFATSSIVVTILFGVAIGNLIVGMPIGADKEFQGNFFSLLSPYSLLTGVFNLSMFALHGSTYLIGKSEGELRERMRAISMKIFWAFVFLYILTTAITLYLHPEMMANFSFGMIAPVTGHSITTNHSFAISVVAWAVVALNILAIANVPRCVHKGKELQGFITTACIILAVVLFFALGIFPNMLVSSITPENSLSIYNGSSSQYTLKTMFNISIWGLPFALVYTSLIYWTYRGKTVITKDSY